MSLAQEEERRSKKVRGGGFGMEIGSRSESYARVLFLKRVKYCWKGLDSSYAMFSLKSVCGMVVVSRGQVIPSSVGRRWWVTRGSVAAFKGRGVGVKLIV